MPHIHRVRDDEWTEWRERRDAALATKDSLCPPPPCATAFLRTLIATRSLEHRYRLRLDACAWDDRAQRQTLLGCRVAASTREREVTRQLLLGIEAPQVRSLCELTICEAKQAGWMAREAGSRGGIVARCGDTLWTIPPQFVRAMAYIYPMLAWSGVKLVATPAGRGVRSTWTLVPMSRVEAGRWKQRPRRAMFSQIVPRPAARDTADRMFAWLAVEVARLAEGKPAVTSILAGACSMGPDCLGRLALRDRIAPRAPDDPGAARSELAPPDERLSDVARVILDGPVPAVTLRGRRGAPSTLCAVCKAHESSARYQKRERTGYVDPSGRSSERIMSQVEYRAMLDEAEYEAWCRRVELEDAAGLNR